MTIIENTPERVAQHYSACIDSVNLINELKALKALTEEDSRVLQANRDHLQLMLSKNFWTVQDLAPLQLAIT